MNAHHMDWSDLRFVLAVSREGTLAGAARLLRVNHSTVFRRIAGVEEQLGVRLFDRLASGYAMTEAGEEAFKSACRVEDEILGLSRKLVGGDLRLNGRVRLSAPDGLTMGIVLPHLVAFRRVQPQIEVELFVSSKISDLTKREADVALRSTRTPPEAVTCQRLCSLASTVYASAAYLRQHVFENLGDNTWLVGDDSLSRYPAATWQARHYPQATVALRSNSLLALQEAAELSMGVAPLPCFLADQRAGLERLIAPPIEMATEVWLLTHPDLRRTARVRALMDFLSEAVERDRALIEGHRPWRQSRGE